MIELFITDIDGCLLDPLEIPDWDILTEIRSLNEQSKHDEAIPPLTLCSGRPLPYVEAIAQMMGIDQPFVFESAGIFDPVQYKMHLNDKLTDETRTQIDKLKKWLQRQILNKEKGFSLEFTKIMDAGIVHSDQEVIQETLPRIRDYVHKNYPDFEVHPTPVSINIIFEKNTKENGIQTLCDWNDISASNVAFVGDSSGDVSGLKLAGQPFAPNNASRDVKKVSRVLSCKSTRAVLAAYKDVIKLNKS